MRVTTEAAKLGNSFQQLGKDILAGFKGQGAAAASGTSRTPLLLKPVEKAGKMAVWMVEQPIALAMKAVGSGAKSVGAIYRKAPVVAWTLTAVGAGLAYKHHQDKKEQQAAALQKQEELGMLEQQMMAATQPQMPQAVASSYTVTPADMEVLNQRLRGGEGRHSGHAEALLAAREAKAAAANGATAAPV